MEEKDFDDKMVNLVIQVVANYNLLIKTVLENKGQIKPWDMVPHLLLMKKMADLGDSPDAQVILSKLRAKQQREEKPS